MYEIGFISLNKDIGKCREEFSKYYLEYKPDIKVPGIHNVEKFTDPLIGRTITLLYGGEIERLHGLRLDILEISVKRGEISDLNAFDRISKAIEYLKIANNDLIVRIFYV